MAVTYRPIWHGDSGRHVLLRSSLTLAGPCHGGQLLCAASGPFQLYLDGIRVAGAPGGAATESPLWYPRDVSGSWDAAEHELVAVIDGGPQDGARWFAIHGELTASATGTTSHTIESGLHWHSLELPPAPTATEADERFSALEDPRAEGLVWQGVVTVDATPVGTAPDIEEQQIEAREFVAFEETEAGNGLTFSPVAAMPRRGKFVHSDDLLAGPAPAASLQTPAERGFTFVLDFGRIVTGIPNLRLRDGRSGIVDIGLATTWGHIERRLRYVCGSGRQDWFALHPVRLRYAVIHLSGFDEECQLERLAICVGTVPVVATTTLELGESFDSTWTQAPVALRNGRLNIYDTIPPPQSCDWLGVMALASNDAARTGHTATTRATLLGRAPGGVGAAGSAFAACLEVYHLWSGDDDTVRRLLPAAVSSAMAATEGHPSTQQIAEQAMGAAAAARTCRRLGRTTEADDCETRLQGLFAAIESRWRDPAGLYVDAAAGEQANQFTQTLVLLAGAPSAERVSRLVTSMRGSGVTPVADLRQAFFLAEALWRSGQSARALAVVQNQWLRIADRDGFTWRDKRGAEADRLAPGPDYLLVRWLLGVTPLEPGFRRTQIRPAFALIPRARAELVTPNGSLRLSWRTVDAHEDENTTLTVEIEGDGSTEVTIDRGDRRQPTLSVNGEVVWRNEKMYPNPSVQEIAAEEDAVTLVLNRPGTWNILVE